MLPIELKITGKNFNTIISGISKTAPTKIGQIKNRRMNGQAKVSRHIPI